MLATENKAENVNFKVHQDILYSLLFKQHHSLVGALVELIQNAFDADATRIDITFNRFGFSISDNGKGFSNREEIISWFATFGKSHDADYGNKFGRFRMGRGQIMGKARTWWSSNEFTMAVDVKKNGMTFDLSTGNEINAGCNIKGEWYDENQFGVEGDFVRTEGVYLKDALTNRCKYIFPVSIFVNGELISVSETSVTWSYENDLYGFIEADSRSFYRSGGSIKVYNLGIFCGYIDVPGLSGDVITKEHVSLNMTRSEIQQDCPVIKRIKRSLHKLRKFHASKKYSPVESRAILEDFCRGELDFFQIKNLLLFTNIKRNTWYSFDTLCEIYFSFSYTDNEIANDRIAQTFHGVVLDSSCLPYLDSQFEKIWEEAVGASNFSNPTLLDHEKKTKMEISFFSGFMSALVCNEYFRPTQHRHVDDFERFVSRMVDFRNIVHLADLSHRVLDSNQLSLKEALRFNAVNKAFTRLVSGFNLRLPLKVGESVNANGWTDCENFIAIERKLLNSIDKGVESTTYLGQVLFHEIAHCKNMNGENHDANFYKTFHDISMRISATDFAAAILKEYDTLLAKHKIVPSGGIIRAMRLFRRCGKSFSLKNKNVYESKITNFYGFDVNYNLRFMPIAYGLDGKQDHDFNAIDSIMLTSEDSALIYEIISHENWSYWHGKEQAISYRNKNESNDRLITLSIPLVTFRTAFCEGRYGKQPERLYALLGELRAKAFDWKQAGVDSIVLVGRFRVYEDEKYLPTNDQPQPIQ